MGSLPAGVRWLWVAAPWSVRRWRQIKNVQQPLMPPWLHSWRRWSRWKRYIWVHRGGLAGVRQRIWWRPRSDGSRSITAGLWPLAGRLLMVLYKVRATWKMKMCGVLIVGWFHQGLVWVQQRTGPWTTRTQRRATTIHSIAYHNITPAGCQQVSAAALTSYKTVTLHSSLTSVCCNWVLKINQFFN